MELIEKAPAKINLSLDALYRHADGEHEWQMVMTSVDLADYVSIKPSHRFRFPQIAVFYLKIREIWPIKRHWRSNAMPISAKVRGFILKNTFPSLQVWAVVRVMQLPFYGA